MPPLDASTPVAATTGSAASSSPARKLTGPQRALAKLGLHRDIDLALHLPLRYDDETQLVRIADARDGQTVQVEGVVRECRVDQRMRRQLLVRIDDGSDALLLRFLHFYPSQLKAFAVGTRVRARGEVRGGFFGVEIVHPTVKAVDADTPLPTSLTPVYPTSAQLPQAYLRKAIASALQRAPLDELLPPGCVPAGLPSLRRALQTLHHPPPDVDRLALEERTHPAWQRLKFDELLAQQLAQVESKAQRAALRAPRLQPRPGGLHARLLAALPFALTAAQQRVAAEMAHDIGDGSSGDLNEGPAPMHRLLQGDVGSGKTVIAALAAAIAIDAGWQCALMAPTELLAEQHFRKLLGWLAPLLREPGPGSLDGDDRIAWLTGSRKGKQRKEMVERVASGRAGLVVGTHAVIQDDVHFARLGLAIVDEQHRFGVQQRLQLRRKLAVDGLEPHLLMMSATPIPRTLAMSYFADLDVSTIDELPPGRTPVVTKLFADDKRDAVVARIRDAVAEGRQVYWVCPLIEESEALDLRNATETHAELQAALPGAQVGLLHGRMAPADKAQVMAAFHAGVLAVLVATTVIEVGVDVPNASLMVIEHAERFGLSQLHQLRGRVGRGSVASVCVLLYTAPLSPTGKARLQAMAQTTDGFEIARRDLEIRGPGDFMGQRQSGDALLRFGDPNVDAGLVAAAAEAAPRLMAQDRRVAALHVQRWLGGGADYLKA